MKTFSLEGKTIELLNYFERFTLIVMAKMMIWECGLFWCTGKFRVFAYFYNIREFFTLLIQKTNGNNLQWDSIWTQNQKITNHGFTLDTDAVSSLHFDLTVFVLWLQQRLTLYLKIRGIFNQLELSNDQQNQF